MTIVGQNLRKHVYFDYLKYVLQRQSQLSLTKVGFVFIFYTAVKERRDLFFVQLLNYL